MTMSSRSPGDPSAGDRQYPMSDTAYRRLADEENRLAEMARELNVGGPQGEAPDAASVAASIRKTDAVGRRLVAIRSAVAGAAIAEEPEEAVIGRTVSIREDGTADTFRLVIPGGGDPANGAISIDSPLGGALLGSRPGDRVEYETPGGVRSAVVEAVDEDEGPPY